MEDPNIGVVTPVTVDLTFPTAIPVSCVLIRHMAHTLATVAYIRAGL